MTRPSFRGQRAVRRSGPGLRRRRRPEELGDERTLPLRRGLRRHHAAVSPTPPRCATASTTTAMASCPLGRATATVMAWRPARATATAKSRSTSATRKSATASTTCDGSVPVELDVDGDDGDLQGDCDDGEATVYPAAEGCDGLDNDCDGIVPTQRSTWTSTASPCAGDCDDSDDTVNLAAPEICDGLDNDTMGHPRRAGRRHGQRVHVRWRATPRPLHLRGATELCDSLDNGCNRLVPGDEIDNDGDSLSQCSEDCDDADPVLPGPQGCATGWTTTAMASSLRTRPTWTETSPWSRRGL